MFVIQDVYGLTLEKTKCDIFSATSDIFSPMTYKVIEKFINCNVDRG